MKNNIKITFIFATALAISCNKLDEKVSDALVRSDAASVTAADVLKSIYITDIRNFMAQDNLWAIQEHTTDECVGPTRGGDWDDNGIWRVLHQHTWDANHTYVRVAFENLGRVVYDATDALNRNPTPQQAAEAKFLRAFANFYYVEGWNQAPYREPSLVPTDIPKVRIGTDALDYVISELEAAKGALPDGPATLANKNACRALLMKCYLTKALIANRVAPQHQPADMNKVIALADEIIGTGTFSLSSNFYNNFVPKNDVLSTENIFTGFNEGGVSSGNVQSRFRCTMHYSQNPGGWNGFTTLSDFYDKFEPTDKRRGDALSGVTDSSGLKVGFLVGQQFDQKGAALKDRKGGPLSFTRAVKSIETDPTTLEVTGIRVVKYPPDYKKANLDNPDNDYVFLRFADVLLMKAEAILRGGTGTSAGSYGSTPLDIVNFIRTDPSRDASALASLSLDNLIDERGRELYWEGWRRMDLIRFGKFLQPGQLRKSASGSERLLFPIPAQQLAANPNLKQNPGY
jgi:starch-binding outer membrane protein, SusD/RagB family